MNSKAGLLGLDGWRVYMTLARIWLNFMCSSITPPALRNFVLHKLFNWRKKSINTLYFFFMKKQLLWDDFWLGLLGRRVGMVLLAEMCLDYGTLIGMDSTTSGTRGTLIVYTKRMDVVVGWEVLCALQFASGCWWTCCVHELSFFSSYYFYVFFGWGRWAIWVLTPETWHLSTPMG